MGGARGSRDAADFLTNQKLRKPLPHNGFRTRSQRRDRWIVAFPPHARQRPQGQMTGKPVQKPKQKPRKRTPLKPTPDTDRDTGPGFSEDTSSGCSRCHCPDCLASRGTRLCRHCGIVQPLTGFRRKYPGHYTTCKHCERIQRSRDDLAALAALETASTVTHAGETLRELVRRHNGHQGFAAWLAHILDSASAQGRMRDAAHILATLAVIGGLSVLADPQEIQERIRGNRT